VWSVREGFEDGMFAEIGAVRIASTHQRVLAYVDELGLETQEFPSGDPMFYVKGQRFMKREGEAWPIDGLNDDEKTAGLYDLWGMYVQSRFDEFGDPSQGMFSPALEEQYDPITWAEYLREQGASEAYVSLFAADNGSEVYAIGALAWMMAEAFYHHCWKDDPWAKGAWTDYLPGQWWMFAVARRPEGRVFFAGEHTSAWAGWMEGAIDSGQRAADEVMGIA